MREPRHRGTRAGGPTLFELGLFAYTWLALLGVDLALRLGMSPRLDSSPGVTARPADDVLVIRLARWVDAAIRRHLCPVRCLPRAMVLRHLLRCHGVSARLCIGVHRSAGVLAAHAWVEAAGRPLGETSGVAERFLPLEAWGDERMIEPPWAEGNGRREPRP